MRVSDSQEEMRAKASGRNFGRRVPETVSAPCDGRINNLRRPAAKTQELGDWVRNVSGVAALTWVASENSLTALSHRMEKRCANLLLLICRRKSVSSTES